MNFHSAHLYGLPAKEPSLPNLSLYGVCANSSTLAQPANCSELEAQHCKHDNILE